MSRTRIVAMLLLLATMVIYLPSGTHGFTLYDDTVYISENPTVQAGLTWDGIKWAFTTFHADNWHPMTWLSLMLDCQVFGLDAASSHLINALIHSVNTVLVFLLLLRLFGGRPEFSTPQVNPFWPCVFVAALFGWHPLHVESVAWIAERKDVLSTFFALLALLIYARRFSPESSVPSPQSTSNVRPATADCGLWTVDYFATLSLFACSLMAKSMFVTLPFVMLLLDWWPLGRFRVPGSRFKVILEKVPFFVFVLVSCVLTFEAQRRGGAVASLAGLSLSFRAENALVAYARYLFEMVWPMNLALFNPLHAIPAAVLLTSIALLGLISTVAWRLRQTQPWLLLGWLWYLGTLVPVIGLVQVGGAAVSDRYTYFPSIGIFMALALTAARTNWRTPLAAAAVAVLMACALLTHRQLGYWRDDIALFAHAAAVTKNNDTAHLNYGYALEKAGRDAEAIAEYRAALKLNPDNAPALNNLGLLLEFSNQNEEALRSFQRALEIDPRFVAAQNNLGVLLVKLGRFEEGMKQFEASAKIDPADWHSPFLMSKALLKQGRDLEAVPYLRQTVRLGPDNPISLLFVAQVLASDEDPNVRDGKTAFLLAQKATTLTGNVQPAMIDALAMAFAELGRFDDARNAAQDALTLAERYKMNDDIPLIRQRLELYQANRPFRQSFKDTPENLKEPAPVKPF